MNRLITVVLATFLVFGCASKMSMTDKNTAYENFVSSNNLQDVNKITSFHFTGWSSLSDDYLILTTNFRKDYLLKMQGGCVGLNFAQRIRLNQFSDSTFDKLGDSISFKDSVPMRCRVAAIYPITQDQSKAIKQIGKEKPQQ